METQQADLEGYRQPERVVPLPETISQQAREFLATPSFALEPLPETNEPADWAAHIATVDQRMAEMLAAVTFPVDVTAHPVEECVVYEATPQKGGVTEDGAILYFHGGGYIYGRGDAGAKMASSLAVASGLPCFCPDYRMPPEHPFPAALDDAVAAYLWLAGLIDPARILIAGNSAGGGLAAASLLKLRDIGVTMPAGAILATPEADLTEAGDTFHTNYGLDRVLAERLMPANLLYANGHDLRDPYLSPVYGTFDGFPPVMLLSGTRDLFLSNTVRLHRAMRRDGVQASLHVWEAMPHGGFFGAPEDAEMLAEQVSFIQSVLSPK